MHDEDRRRQDDERYRRFFLKVADRLKSPGFFDDPAIPAPAHWLEFRSAYPWVHYRAAFLPRLREARQLMFSGEDGEPFFWGPEARVAVVIHNHDVARNHRLFDFILKDKTNIESKLGELIWERERNGESHISVRLPNCTIDDSPMALKEVEDWFVQTLKDFAGVFWRQLPTKPAWSFFRNWSHKSWSYKPDRTISADISLEEWWEHDQDRAAVGIVIRTLYNGRYEGADTEREAHALAIRQEVLDALTQQRTSIESGLGPLHWGLPYTDKSYRMCAFLFDRTCFDDDAEITATRRWIDDAVEKFKRVFEQVADTIELHEE